MSLNRRKHLQKISINPSVFQFTPFSFFLFFAKKVEILKHGQGNVTISIHNVFFFHF
jgi:hypothetical protein